jgi:hypothetical protein
MADIIGNQDLIDMQIYAARYAHNRRTFAAHTMNQITLKMIENGIYPIPDTTRNHFEEPDSTEGAPSPTVWVRDGDFGWPMDLIEKHGWDGRKLRPESR